MSALPYESSLAHFLNFVYTLNKVFPHQPFNFSLPLKISRKNHEEKNLPVFPFMHFIQLKCHYSFTPPNATPAMMYLDKKA